VGLVDKIKLIVKTLDNQEYVDIYINNERLIDIIKRIELKYDSKIAGSYKGLPTDIVFLPSRHLLDRPYALYDYGDKVSVLECECGCAGCWDLNVKITLEDDKVVWSDFEQPHRDEDSAGGYWKYDELKPFVFDRNEYEVELSKQL
jgi:hypothetical protein